MDKKLFAAKLRFLRNNKGLNQQQLSELIGVGRTTISMWENAKNVPDITYANKLSLALNTSIDYLVGKENFDIEQLKAENNIEVKTEQIPIIKYKDGVKYNELKEKNI